MFPLLLRTLEERRTSLAVALGHAGCARGPTEPARVGVGDLSVVLVILDAAGAPYLGAYGNPSDRGRRLGARASGCEPLGVVIATGTLDTQIPVGSVTLSIR